MTPLKTDGSIQIKSPITQAGDYTKTITVYDATRQTDRHGDEDVHGRSPAAGRPGNDAALPEADAVDTVEQTPRFQQRACSAGLRLEPTLQNPPNGAQMGPVGD
jgi:hypothetical protein